LLPAKTSKNTKKIIFTYLCTLIENALEAKEIVKKYIENNYLRAFADLLHNKKEKRFQVRGLVGSLDAFIVSAIFQITNEPQLIILHDKEEAGYFYNDLQSLNDDQFIHLLPFSYKKPYEFDEVENANVLLRTEVLNNLKNKSYKGIVVTYPDALSEKVINKKSFQSNTFSAKRGDKIDVSFLSELLINYDFEKTDFVYEAGQFAVRGGIIDVFSYSNPYPYRLDLFGDEIETIKIFDPTTQLSTEECESMEIIPDVQTKLSLESRESFLNFISENTLVWVKNLHLLYEVIDKYFSKAQESFHKIVNSSGTKIIAKPEELFENHDSFKESLVNHRVIEFGNTFAFRNTSKITFESSPQPSFNKDFNLLIENLNDNHSKGFENYIFSDSGKQIERLSAILEELTSSLNFKTVGASLREGFIDHQLSITCYTDHQIFNRFHRYKERSRFSKSKALTLKELRSLSPGDYVTHVDYGIGRFAGLEKVDVGGKEQEAIRLVYKDDDLLYVSIHSLHKISKYSGKEGGPPQVNKLGSAEWENKKSRVKRKVKDIAKELIELYAKRKAAPGHAFSKDSVLQAELESSFLYEDTPDQAKATSDLKVDMEQPHPMDRLICGDVGFGKTEVAIRAAFKAVDDGKQVAVLVPTTILAMQHYRTFSERLEKFPVRVEYINRFKSPTEIKNISKDLEAGKVDILIGTHRLVNKDLKFKDLGLLIIDEEQKFGVAVKEKLKELKVDVDTLTLTATPIPRTLHFSLMGARDLSVISTPPPNRQPVTTEVHIFNDVLIRDAVSFELKRGGQVFFVHNRISDIEEIGNLILRLVPDARIAIAHGQMEGSKLEKIMMKFIEGEYDVLVSTNIIESGLDIPNANTIMINRAHMFGLSDLHQMRGRVGRSNKKAFCFLLTPSASALTADARKRLATLEEFSELGDGFKVAMRDLDIRGAGNLLGAEQSGFINDLGFEIYHKILDETITELKETEFKDLFMKDSTIVAQNLTTDCSIETDFEILIPDTYVSNISERLNLYSTVDSINDEEGLEKFKLSLIDRFGPLPDPVKDLIETVRLRWIAENLGFEKLTVKNNTLKASFPSAENEVYYKSEIFTKILQYIQNKGKNCKLNENKNKLTLLINSVTSVKEAIKTLESILS
jgi:transcription-repair coupling factor (superfamily II helicase)